MSLPMCSPQVVPESRCSNIKDLGILSHQLGWQAHPWLNTSCYDLARMRNIYKRDNHSNR